MRKIQNGIWERDYIPVRNDLTNEDVNVMQEGLSVKLYGSESPLKLTCYWIGNPMNTAVYIHTYTAKHFTTLGSCKTWLQAKRYGYACISGAKK